MERMMRHSLKIFKRLKDFHIQYILTHCLRFLQSLSWQIAIAQKAELKSITPTQERGDGLLSDIIANDFSLALPETKFSCSITRKFILHFRKVKDWISLISSFFFLSSLEVLVLLPFRGKNGSLMKLLSTHPTFTNWRKMIVTAE